MIGIQDGYNKNFQISALDTKRSFILMIVLRYGDSDIKVVLVE